MRALWGCIAGLAFRGLQEFSRWGVNAGFKTTEAVCPRLWVVAADADSRTCYTCRSCRFQAGSLCACFVNCTPTLHFLGAPPQLHSRVLPSLMLNCRPVLHMIFCTCTHTWLRAAVCGVPLRRVCISRTVHPVLLCSTPCCRIPSVFVGTGPSHLSPKQWSPLA